MDTLINDYNNLAALETNTCMKEETFSIFFLSGAEDVGSGASRGSLTHRDDSCPLQVTDLSTDR